MGGRDAQQAQAEPDIRNQRHESVVALATTIRDRYTFRGIAIAPSLEALRAYLTNRPLPFQVYLVESLAWLDGASLTGTPTTVLTDDTGRVRRVWVGVYGDIVGPSIGSYFGVRIPGPVRPVRVTETR